MSADTQQSQELKDIVASFEERIRVMKAQYAERMEERDQEKQDRIKELQKEIEAERQRKRELTERLECEEQGKLCRCPPPSHSKKYSDPSQLAARAERAARVARAAAGRAAQAAERAELASESSEKHGREALQHRTHVEAVAESMRHRKN